MKWIGQNIQSFISRFRNDVYLESISSGTIASGAHLGLDSNNKIVKAVDGGGDLTSIVAGTGLSGTSLTGPIPTLNVDASIPEITTLAGLTSFGDAGVTTNIVAGDLSMYNAVNDGNPTINIGSSATERLEIKAEYESGAQGLDAIRFTTFTAGSGGDDGRYVFEVDDAFLFAIKDAGVQIKASGALEIGTGNTILSDSSGTTTLNNIDALDATTEATIETAIDTLSNLTAASSLVTVGTIGTGVWNGTAVASAYLDADTMHYSAQRQITHHMIKDDIGTGVVYISLGELDAESGTKSNKNLPLLAPVAGKLLKVFLRTTQDMSGSGHDTNLTWRLLTRTTSVSTTGNAAVVGTQTGAGPTASSMVTYDFTSSLDSGTNAIVAGDKVLLSVQSDAASADSSFFITCLWEWDLS